MYVACPSCQTLYEIKPEHLSAAGGRLRCGSCQTIFDAAAAVFDDPQRALDYALQHPLRDDVAEEIDELVNRALDQVPGDDHTIAQQSGSQSMADEGLAGEGAAERLAALGAAGEPEADRESSSMADRVIEDIVLESIEEPGVYYATRHADTDVYAQPVSGEFARRPQESASVQPEFPEALLLDESYSVGPRTPWRMIAVSLLLIVFLVGQYVHADRYRLAQFPQLRATLEFLCKPLGCGLPLRHDLSRFEMIEREVRDHPRVDDALLIHAAFENRADFVQAYPVFQVSFSDMSGTAVAVRRFHPRDYLGLPQNPSKGMAPGEQIRLRLEVVDPGDRAVSFQFDFL